MDQDPAPGATGPDPARADLRAPVRGVAPALEALRDEVAGVRLGLATAEAAEAQRAARAVVEQVDDYLLPRLEQLDAPLLMVVGGSTGAGKSTLVNALVRPRSRPPACCARPRAARCWCAHRRTGLVRRRPGAAPAGPGTGAGADAGPGTLRLVEHRACRAGLALLDAPDIDSVVETNRDLAAQLLAAADLWVFVTTAARYADAVPWDLLHAAAQERATALAVVLDRVPPEARAEVAATCAGCSPGRGCDRARLFVVRSARCRTAGCREGGRAAARLARPLAADAEARAAVVRRTLDGALDSLAGRVPALVGAAARRRTRPPRACARRGGLRVRRRPDRRSTRASATARCCAARCSPAGRRSSAPAS